jgi:uncharacterized protein YutE (UPF0331/DUF86 family)
MDPLILAEKLESLRRCVARIEDRRADSAEALRQDIDRQDILNLNLTRAVQLCVDMAVHVLSDTEQPPPQTMGEAFDQLAAERLITPDLAKRMRAAVGFRNVAVYSYQAMTGTSSTTSRIWVCRIFDSSRRVSQACCRRTEAFFEALPLSSFRPERTPSRHPGRSALPARHPGRSALPARHPGRSALPARHPGRSEAESRDPWGPGSSPRFVASPGVQWTPDQVRGDGLRYLVRSAPPARHPGRSALPARHPGRSEAESRDPWGPGRSPRFVASPGVQWTPDQVRGDGLRYLVRSALPARHPGRSEAESRDPWGPDCSPRFVASPGVQWTPDQVRGDGLRYLVRSAPPARHPGRSALPARHPGRSEAESRDPWGPGRSPRFVASPGVQWTPDQVRGDGLRYLVRSALPARHPGRSEAESRDPWGPDCSPRFVASPGVQWTPDQVRGDGLRYLVRSALPARHPGRSEAESRDPWGPGRSPRFVASPGVQWTPDQVRGDGLRYLVRSAPTPVIPAVAHFQPVIPAVAKRRAGIHGGQVGLRGSWFRPALHGPRIKSGVTSGSSPG